ncbi:MAG: SurA N-terminal domain-containing protein, partial [Chloroflexi bacterium]|nr:SurA N-terminal domain-containing protein [Chloroflexota bacterium]
MFLSILVVILSACRGNPTPIVSYEPMDGAFEGNRPVAARVNHQPIFLETYEKQSVRFEQTLRTQGVDLTSARGQTILAQVRQRVLETLIDQSLIEQ